jgi:FkbM family methyltransferase
MEIVESSANSAISFYSHPAHRQDQWVIQDVFKNRRGGYFVEAGAAGASNTYALEKYLGWTGLAVEPHPGLFEEIKAKRHCILENVCLTDVESEVQFIINHNIPGTSAMPDAISKCLKKNFHDGVQTETIRVQGYPLWELLRKHGAPKEINYLSLDIEGAEWLALKNFPFAEYSFDCMTIERGSDDYLRLRAKLLREGYRLVRVGRPDDFWVHPRVPYHVPFRDVLNTAFRRVVQPIKARLST